jgi:outer membrane protein OmpA-like peptidoglycan-associated protein
LAAASERQRLAAAVAERAEAERVFKALAQPNAAPNAADDARFLWRRAEARFAAAVALNADAAERIDRATQLSAALSASPSKRATSEPAQQALRSAERALGAARKLSSPASPEQAGDLVQCASERGFDAVSEADGVVVSSRNAFVPGRVDTQAQMRRRLQLLRDLLVAYPHGVIRVACSANGSSASALALARTRAARTAAFLADAGEAARWQVDEPSPASPERPELRLLFTAYARTAPASP